MQINIKASERNFTFRNNRSICMKVRAWNKQIGIIFYFWILVNLSCNCRKKNSDFEHLFKKFYMNMMIFFYFFLELTSKSFHSNMCQKLLFLFFIWLFNGVDHLESMPRSRNDLYTPNAGKHLFHNIKKEYDKNPCSQLRKKSLWFEGDSLHLVL